MTYADTDIELQLDEELRAQNFSVFKERYGCVPQIDPDENNKYRMGLSKDEEAVLFVKNALSSGDLRMNSLYNPLYEATRWAEQKETTHRRTSVALLGFSTGIYLRALYLKYRPDTRFFVYEKEEGLFSFVCGFMDLSNIIADPRINLYVTKEQRLRLSDEMITDAVDNRPEAVGIVTPYYANDEVFSNVCEEVARVMEATKNYQSDRGRVALKARMYSWHHMRTSSTLKALRERIPNGIPAVIVSAGPSLRKNVDKLSMIKGHALIICTDRAVSILDEHHIIPDMVISLDAEKNPDYLKAAAKEGVPLICSHQVNIDTQKMFEGNIIFYHALEYEMFLMGNRMLESNNGLDQGGNVAGGAFTVCKMLGIKKIILIGQDLAYIDGKHHADDKDEGDSEAGIKEIEGIYGDKVKSSDMWISFKSFFERQIGMNPDLDVIDATEGGAKIYGTRIMSLREAIDNELPDIYDLDGLFSNLPKAQTNEEFAQMIEREKGWIADLDEIIESSKELETLCGQLLKISKYNNIADPKNGKKLNRMDKLRLAILQKMVYVMMQEFWIQDMYSLPDQVLFVRNNEEAIPVFENSVSFYKQLQIDCESLKEELQNAMNESE